MSADRFELELTTMAHGGSALGRHEGQTVFVPYTLPGERALVRVTEGRGKIAFARVERLLAASADRVLPQCPHFARACCSSWQHIDYAAQLLLKQDILNDQLQRIAGLTDAEIESAVQPLIASPIQWGYNHHMTLHVSDSGEIGLPDADNRIIPLDECSLLHPDLLALYETLDLDFPNLRRLKLQIGTDGAHMLMLSVAGDEPPELETDLPTSVNMLLEDNEPVNLIGASHSRYEVRGHSFRVTAGGFFRANIAQLDNLVGAVLNALTLTGDQRVLDGYAGVGLFSAFGKLSARRHRRGRKPDRLRQCGRDRR
jgi:23S rRNA (uracil1939-C5)-methyltransferase